MALIFAIAGLAAPTRWRWLAISVGGAFVLLVGLSRVYLGVHYPSDVLAGWCAALAWVSGLLLLRHVRGAGPAAPSQGRVVVAERGVRRLGSGPQAGGRPDV